MGAGGRRGSAAAFWRGIRWRGFLWGRAEEAPGEGKGKREDGGREASDGDAGGREAGRAV